MFLVVLLVQMVMGLKKLNQRGTISNFFLGWMLNLLWLKLSKNKNTRNDGSNILVLLTKVKNEVLLFLTNPQLPHHFFFSFFSTLLKLFVQVNRILNHGTTKSMGSSRTHCIKTWEVLVHTASKHGQTLCQLVITQRD